jgi:uncharacterized LabA/DUF88 family protein
MATGIYIDGLNLYYGALRGSSHKWLDLEKFVRLLLPNDEIAFIRYFSARVNSRYGETGNVARQAAYFRAVQENPLVRMTLGYVKQKERLLPIAESRRLPHELFVPSIEPIQQFNEMWQRHIINRNRPFTCVRISIDEEKGTDVNLAAHLINDAHEKTITKALVISNDGDFREAISLARQTGIAVGVCSAWEHSANRQLKEVMSFEIRLRPDSLTKCQMPQTIQLANGRHVSRPKNWA